MKKNVEQPVVSTEETYTHEHNEVNFDLPPKFDEYEEHEKETTKEEEEEKGIIGEVVTQADEGEMLHVKGVLFGFQRIAEQPKEDPFHTQEEKTIIPSPLVSFKPPRISVPKNKKSPIEIFPHIQQAFFKSFMPQITNF